jgi:hypothetical protein
MVYGKPRCDKNSLNIDVVPTAFMNITCVDSLSHLTRYSMKNSVNTGSTAMNYCMYPRTINIAERTSPFTIGTLSMSR